MYTHACMHPYIHTCMYTHACMHPYIHTCMYVHNRHILRIQRERDGGFGVFLCEKKREREGREGGGGVCENRNRE
jgi:hypothetical protein